ncbi:DNA-directed RNA polymerase III subunit [Citrus sinensis]|uniref:DNA-directed RNA polymerase III subunit n=1 Tax=Citrus sinensis TaxID=2711 RepID=A0ACB8J8S5_CITSI|nr:DNA-directed RNA polymerase III subunit [Citrus sinensis]
MDTEFTSVNIVRCELNQQLREATGCSRGTQQAAAAKQTQHQQPAPAPTRCSSGCQRTSHWNSCDAAAAKPAAATRTHATQQHRTQLSHLNPLTQTSSKPSPTPPQGPKCYYHINLNMITSITSSQQLLSTESFSFLPLSILLNKWRIEGVDVDEVAMEAAVALASPNKNLLNFSLCGSFGFFMNLVSDSQSVDIERYSDWNKPKVSSNRGSINQFLQLHSSNFPAELVKDSREQRNPKRVRWNADAGMRKLDLFEKLEQKFQGQEDKDEKEKKEGEDEDEDDGEAAGEAEEEFSDDGDYNQNIDFDDDEDDFNMDDGNDGMHFLCNGILMLHSSTFLHP